MEPTTKEQEMEALRAKIAQRDAEDDVERQDEELAVLRIKALEGDVVAVLKKLYGKRGVGFEVYTISGRDFGGGRLIACHTPKGPHWEAFVATVKADEPLEPHEVRNVVRRSMIESGEGLPEGSVMTKAEFDVKALEYPAMPAAIADGLHTLAKGGAKARKAK